MGDEPAPSLGILEGRKRKTAAYWFSKVTPVDTFSFSGGRLCFRDVAPHYRLARDKGRTMRPVGIWHEEV